MTNFVCIKEHELAKEPRKEIVDTELLIISDKL